jgi:hypothetical protein
MGISLQKALTGFFCEIVENLILKNEGGINFRLLAPLGNEAPALTQRL